MDGAGGGAGGRDAGCLLPIVAQSGKRGCLFILAPGAGLFKGPCGSTGSVRAAGLRPGMGAAQGGQGCDLAFLAAGTGACNRASGSTGGGSAAALLPVVAQRGQGLLFCFGALGAGGLCGAGGSTGRLYAVFFHPDVGTVFRVDDIRRGADRGELVAQSVEGGFAVADTGIDVYPVAVHVELGLAAGVVGLQGDVEKAVDGIGGPDAAHPAGGGGGAVLDVDGFIP